MKKRYSKHYKNTLLREIIVIILFIIFILGIGYSIYYFYNLHKDKKVNSNILDNVEVDITQVIEQKSERVLQLEKLKQETNSDIIGWLEIEKTNINYPVCQTIDNEYYMKHNYKKEYSSDGSIFLDKNYNWSLPSTNFLLYGHNNKNGNMFQELLKFEDENYYKEHSKIRFTTLEDDSYYEILAVFKSRVYYKDETNVFRYYYFINAENVDEFNYFIDESKKASLYDTGITAEYGEQLLTLSTCSYHTEDGRFAIVAKKVKE